jgi:uracil-DNA glycosylase family 4
LNFAGVLRMSPEHDLERIEARIIRCRLCPRLVRWREKTAREKVRRFASERYWGRPVPGFGDPRARVLLIGLAPAAHGGNRTGRMFTGDNSGHWLYRALYKSGFASQPLSQGINDGMRLTDCYITATLRCPPPQNKPLPKEIRNCRQHLLAEITFLKNVRIIIGLGKIGFEAALNAYRELGMVAFKARPTFGHCIVHRLDRYIFIGSYHPSQQNTFTGKLTEAMFDKVFAQVKRYLGRKPT